jgi:hypothetical protein
MILTVKVKQYKKELGCEDVAQGLHGHESAMQPISCGELHLVDLAGSEKMDMYTQVSSTVASRSTLLAFIYHLSMLLT